MAESLLARTNLNLLWIICLTSYVYLPLNSRGTFVLWQVVLVAPMHTFYCVTQLKLYTVDKLSSPIFCCLYVCQGSVTPDQISNFSNIYWQTSTLMIQYLI